MREFQLWRVFAVSTLVLGDVLALVMLPIAALVDGFAVGIAVGAYLAGVRREHKQQGVPRESSRKSIDGLMIAGTASGCVASIAIVVQYSVLGLLWLAAIGGCSPMLLNRLAQQRACTMGQPIRKLFDPNHAASPPAEMTPAPVDPAASTNTELRRHWTMTYGQLQRADSEDHWTAIVATRTALLVELERRDPAGFDSVDGERRSRGQRPAALPHQRKPDDKTASACGLNDRA